MAKCDAKTLNGIHGMGAKLGLDIDDLRAMTKGGSLSKMPAAEAKALFLKLREQLDAAQGGPPRRGPWRLYSSSSLYGEIVKYASGIEWDKADGFRTWLVKCFKIEDLRFVSSLEQATAIKNALKRMYNDQRRTLGVNQGLGL